MAPFEAVLLKAHETGYGSPEQEFEPAEKAVLDKVTKQRAAEMEGREVPEAEVCTQEEEQKAWEIKSSRARRVAEVRDARDKV